MKPQPLNMKNVQTSFIGEYSPMFYDTYSDQFEKLSRSGASLAELLAFGFKYDLKYEIIKIKINRSYLNDVSPHQGLTQTERKGRS